MAYFTDYPAARVKTANISGAIQQGIEDSQMNQLRRFQIGQMQADQQRQGQMAQHIPGILRGDQGSIAAGAAIDPEMVLKLSKIPAAQRDQIKQKVGQVADLLAPFADPGLAPIQKSQMWPQMLQRAQEMGLSINKAPRQFDPQWVALKMSEAGQYKSALDRADKAPSGYRYAEGELEHIPGGPADPAQAGRLAEAKRGADGGVTPAQLANNREINEARKRLQEMERDLSPGVSLSEEIHRQISVTDPTTGRSTPDYNSFLGRTAWMAMQRKVGKDRDQARWSRILVNPPEFLEAGPKALPPGVSTEQPGILDRLGEFFSGGDEEPRPASDGGHPRGRPRGGGGRPRGNPRGGGRAKGRGGAKAIEAMSLEEATALIYGNRELTPDEIIRLDKRLNELGARQKGR